MAPTKFGMTTHAVVCAVVAIPAISAAWIDAWTRRLPLPLTGAAITLGVFGTLATGFSDPDASLRALEAAAATFLIMSLLGGILGVFAFGDVLLTLPLVLLVAYHGWTYVGTFALLILAVEFPIAAAAALRQRSKTAVLPLGPALVTAAFLTLALA